MGDMGDYWRDVKTALKEDSQRKRANNRDASAGNLTAAGIPFESKNGGAHLVVSAAGLVVDFWPGTGLWVVRNTNERRRGVRSLIKRLGGRWPPKRRDPMTNSRPAEDQRRIDRSSVPGANLNHDAIAVQLCFSAGLDPDTTDALLYRLKQELRAKHGTSDRDEGTR